MWDRTYRNDAVSDLDASVLVARRAGPNARDEDAWLSGNEGLVGAADDVEAEA